MCLSLGEKIVGVRDAAPQSPRDPVPGGLDEGWRSSCCGHPATIRPLTRLPYPV